MSYGYFGSTLVDELNRLANGGTYPDISLYVDEALAARNWASAKSVSLGEITDTVGVLNYIYGITDRAAMFDIAGICNKIANTTGLEPAAALREVAS